MNNSTDTNSSNVQVDGSTTLTKDEMQNIIGMGWRRRRRRCWDVDTPRPVCPRRREYVRRNAGRWAFGGAQIVGGSLMVIGGGVKIIKTGGLGTGDGLIAIGGGIGLIGSGAAHIQG
ncbi:MAG: hypothetical protein PQ964_08170 [Methanobacteriaceae archaeon]